MSDVEYKEYIDGFEKLIKIGERRFYKFLDKIKKNDIIENERLVIMNGSFETPEKDLFL